ncbi:MAG: hypothetical protein Q8Q08_09750 [Candidatus Omnitrophota bacterium]|nr:hypothetical protein [Candidatus Omnitrophota bacterium]MDZ4242452.1 hypothetical protein [Candidatus Omnitrophota bacterium]
MEGKKRPIGIPVTGGLLIFSGGVGILAILFQVIDSLRVYGIGSLLITSPTALIGFVLYGMLPVLLYSSGVGIFLLRPWAWWNVTYLIPALLIVFFLCMTTIVLREQLHLHETSAIDLVIAYPVLYLNSLVRGLLLSVPLHFYFRRSSIMAWFEGE